jgi:hypothetical protein
MLIYDYDLMTKTFTVYYTQSPHAKMGITLPKMIPLEKYGIITCISS